MIELATIAASICAAIAAVGLFDKIADQVERFITKSRKPDVPVEHRLKIEKEGDAIASKYHGQEKQRITAQDLQKLWVLRSPFAAPDPRPRSSR